MLTVELDGLPLRLKAPHDLGWLKGYGRVFCVFDGLITGNLCFGIEKAGRRLFVKYAGARPPQYAGEPQRAVETLMNTALLHDKLRHPCLSPVLERFETDNGFGLVFPWFEGYALGPLQVHMDAFRRLPLGTRLLLYDKLADFFALAAGRDYVAGGVYDEKILVDFSRQNLMFCSVSRFMQMPARTPYPKLPGSPWYLPPEGYIPGAKLDESINVYAQGALAFTFFGDRNALDLKSWEGAESLHSLAARAVRPRPAQRPSSAAEYLGEWRQAVLRLPG